LKKRVGLRRREKRRSGASGVLFSKRRVPASERMRRNRIVCIFFQKRKRIQQLQNEGEVKALSLVSPSQLKRASDRPVRKKKLRKGAVKRTRGE